MQWTRNIPTEPGWYWYRRRHGANPEVWCVTMVKIYRNWAGQIIVSGWGSPSSMSGEWAGPLEPPTEELEQLKRNCGDRDSHTTGGGNHDETDRLRP